MSARHDSPAASSLNPATRPLAADEALALTPVQDVQDEHRSLEHELVRVATSLGRFAASHGIMLATAESCTGGAIARALTETAGSSDWFDCGFITYSNDAKQAMLGVDPALIQTHGAVSDAVARAMVSGAMNRSRAAGAVAVTGVAGPGGGSVDKPVGLVWFAFAGRAPDGSIDVLSHSQRLPGDRTGVRLRTAIYGLAVLARQLAERHPIA